jgi:hypothetical protein
MDIEHSPSTHDVRMREVGPYLGQRAPVRFLGDPIPVHQGDQRIAVPFGKLEKGWLADHPHNTSLQNVNYYVKGAPSTFGSEKAERNLKTRFLGSQFSIPDSWLSRHSQGESRLNIV